ncbi:hypothetical protein [Streptomyces sp. NBC_00847]|uniref:hypothetical protein n=1 Tax=Streptomyces sp. NBC_00847 TaxID=2975850 RepID=UPI00225E1F5B|nr:hypothetical protein [Streptomyces sp. NBC_00847]MCX4885901.1 hypothetical protein [Streptomyces sp. NBC_00847]
MTDTLPEGHPIPWEDLVPYEQDQGGYWLYPPGCDVYGNGKVFVRVPRPEQPGEIIGYVNRLSLLVSDVTRRAEETGNAQMVALAEELKRVTVPRVRAG